MVTSFAVAVAVVAVHADAVVAVDRYGDEYSTTTQRKMTADEGGY